VDVLPISASIFGVVAIAGGAAGYFKASRGDSIIKYQATEITLRDGTITNLKADLAATTQSCAAKDDTITELKKHNAYLQKLGQGSPELKKLATTQEKLITAIDNQTRAVTALLERKP
jgi:ABC-type transporter Mla subunit MlaD